MLEANDLLQPGQWVRHPKFGDGVVLQTMHSVHTSDEDAAFIDFAQAGKKWIALRSAKLQCLPEGDLSRWQLVQLAEVVRSMRSLPHLRDEMKPLTEIQISAFTSRVWKQSLLTSKKRHRLQYKLEHGERILPLVTSKPLPWITHASLILPLANNDRMPGFAGRHRAGTTRGHPTVHEPRVVVASTPPYKKLRGVLYDVVQGLTDIEEVVRLDIIANATQPASLQQQVLELLAPVEDTACRIGTKIFINDMRRRAVNGIQDLRATAHANGPASATTTRVTLRETVRIETW